MSETIVKVRPKIVKRIQAVQAVQAVQDQPIKDKEDPPVPERELSAREQRYFNHADYQKDGILHIYTDGSAIGNGRTDATGGYGVFFGRKDLNNISAQVIAPKVTNNIAELMAIIEALKVISTLKDKEVVIHYDSDYAASVITGKKNAAKNLELVDEGKKLLASIQNKHVRFEHVYSHTGAPTLHSIGNDIADCLAKRMDLKK